MVLMKAKTKCYSFLTLVCFLSKFLLGDPQILAAGFAGQTQHDPAPMSVPATSARVAFPLLSFQSVFCELWKAVSIIGGFMYVLLGLVVSVIMFVGDLVTFFQFSLYDIYGPFFISTWNHFLQTLDMKCS